MSYPPPPGYKSKPPTPQPHTSLLTRPPPPAQPPAFKPRSVARASSQAWQPQHATISAGPQPPAYPLAQTSYLGAVYPATAYQQTSYYPQLSNDLYANSHRIRNPFPVPGQTQGRGHDSNSAYDPAHRAQIAQWQSAYVNKDDTNARAARNARVDAGNANNTPLGVVAKSNVSTPISNAEMHSAANSNTGVAAVVAGTDGKQKTVVRSGGGQTWQDPSLLEWDPTHFRLFVGNLAGEVTDEMLHKAFSRFPSIQKARVVREKHTTKSRGYGFVSFSTGDDYFQAAREMHGKYIGSHPIKVERSTTEIKAVTSHDKRKNKNNKSGKGANGGDHANTGAGVQKKPNRKKRGLKILG
ncbi:uncharacterized protein K452DRAFT_282411 [Aplosporella prunicola CBS 121167]|uniref:RRM domain-containing protein n=1 Tax=Aplosporella prunicola CBS 121167 TaxID=1176127 RepID=A0A6A6BX41_9PEZI|nr:uncharacterized protein K452DRAFT_282411 [Aplosporella prunicola CBS 121167]KAF2147414.1 hypothetical protein K452DRAFT_282411 [Aplosporella prunicola CBS 121167]